VTRTVPAVAVAESVVAWAVGLAVVGSFLGGVWIAVREPVRLWKHSKRRDASITALAVAIGLLVLFAVSRVVP
jgi:hypothetical protein